MSKRKKTRDKLAEHETSCERRYGEFITELREGFARFEQRLDSFDQRICVLEKTVQRNSDFLRSAIVSAISGAAVALVSAIVWFLMRV